MMLPGWPQERTSLTIAAELLCAGVLPSWRLNGELSA
jgi:hypothetical protein